MNKNSMNVNHLLLALLSSEGFQFQRNWCVMLSLDALLVATDHPQCTFLYLKMTNNRNKAAINCFILAFRNKNHLERGSQLDFLCGSVTYRRNAVSSAVEWLIP